MSFFDSLFPKRRERSAAVAKERLLTVLVHDRVKLTPDMLEQLKAELSAVIARYVPNADAGEIEVTLQHEPNTDRLKADIPLRRGRPEG
jgi:cell division topological specificity factor